VATVATTAAARVLVPNLRGLFARPGQRTTGEAGLHVDMVRLTEHPMAVEGLIAGHRRRRAARYVGPLR
jgi:hypothetical protein